MLYARVISFIVVKNSFLNLGTLPKSLIFFFIYKYTALLETVDCKHIFLIRCEPFYLFIIAMDVSNY